MRHSDFDRLEEEFGIVIPEECRDYTPKGWAKNFRLAMDAQPTLISTPNAGIPFYLTNYIDPKLVEVLVAPNKAAKILGEVKKGDWATLTATFPLIEHTGEVSSYGDWNDNGSTGANANFPVRQSYHYQTVTQWGERQLEIAAQAKIDWAQRLNIASVMVLDKFANNMYLFGVQGLQNYGILNEPSLSAAIAPGTKAAGNGNVWVSGNTINATPNEVYADIQAMYVKLVNQGNGLIDSDTKLKVIMSPQSKVALTSANSFNVNVMGLLKENFPNIEFETVPQYATAAGQLVQMIALDVEGQETGYAAFTEKLRAHAVIKQMSAFKQKKSQGGWGMVVFHPFCITQMIGV